VKVSSYLKTILLYYSTSEQVEIFGVALFFSGACFSSLLISLVLACRRTPKSQKLQKALLSGLIINVKYRSFCVILAGIECA
jgi:tetrahydromethanopterin S-methyltransferase subunit D